LKERERETKKKTHSKVIMFKSYHMGHNPH